MSSNFPTAIDELPTSNSNDTLAVAGHTALHNNANDAIEALETKVGVDSSADTYSLDYKITNLLSDMTTAQGDIDAIEALLPTGTIVGTTDTQELTNKTITSPTLQGSIDGWIGFNQTLTYQSSTTMSGTGFLAFLNVGNQLKFTQLQAYTNDPASGSNIVLNMTNTAAFKVGNTVTVSSSAGSETATVTVVTTNTSITVNSLSLNHTTSSPLVSVDIYAYVTALTNTLITFTSGIDYGFANADITSPYYSKTSPVGFPDLFTTAVGYLKMSGRSLIQWGAKSLTIASGTEFIGGQVDLPIDYPDTNYNISLGGAVATDFATRNETPFVSTEQKTAGSFYIDLITRSGNVAANRTTAIPWRTEGKI